jgi:molecular chaperone GrpE
MADDERQENETTNGEPSFLDESADDVIAEALRSVEAVERESRGANPPEKRTAELELALEGKKAEADEWKDKYLRSVADFENLRKRALKEREESRKYGGESLLRDLLQVLDNMERAVEAAGGVEQIKEGVKLTHDQFKQIMRQHGVEIVEAAGSPFDPVHHEAVAHVSSDEHAPGTVVEEHRRGYRFHERLLRPAMVSVAKAPALPEGDGGA